MCNPSSLCACSGNVTVARRVAVLWRGRGAMVSVRGGAQLACVYPVPSWALLQIFMLYISFGTLFEFICCLPLSMCCCDFVCECEWLLLLQGGSGHWVRGTGCCCFLVFAGESGQTCSYVLSGRAYSQTGTVVWADNLPQTEWPLLFIVSISESPGFKGEIIHYRND